MADDRTTPALVALDTVIAEVLDEFPRHDARAPGDGTWGPREVMSHFLVWHGWLADTAEALAADRRPPASPASGSSIDAANERAAAGAADAAMAEMVTQLEAIHQRARTAIKQIAKPDAVGWPRADGVLVSTPERLDYVRGHFQRHLDELRAGGPLSR